MNKVAWESNCQGDGEGQGSTVDGVAGTLGLTPGEKLVL